MKNKIKNVASDVMLVFNVVFITWPKPVISRFFGRMLRLSPAVFRQQIGRVGTKRLWFFFIISMLISVCG